MTARQSWDVARRCPDCGWLTKVTTAGLAAKALRTHQTKGGCEKHRRLTAAHERGVARMAAVDREPKPCHHKHPHEHGNYVTWTHDACRCGPCAKAAHEYEQGRQRRKAYGRENLVDAKPVREHVRALMDAGVGIKQVSRLSGVSTGTLTKLLYGHWRENGTHRRPARRVMKATAAKLLLLSADQAAARAKVDAESTARMLRSLVARGWPVAQIAERMGLNRQAIDPLLDGQWITTARTVQRVREHYARLAFEEAPTPSRYTEASLRRAEANGWVAPPVLRRSA